MRYLTATVLFVLSLTVLADPGDLDLSFGKHKGHVRLLAIQDSHVSIILQQQDGKLVIAGTVTDQTDEMTSHVALWRLNIDGTLDKSFNSSGMVITKLGSGWNAATSAVLQADGKIVISGYNGTYESLLIRYSEDGSLDSTFGEDGIAVVSGVPSGLSYSVITQTDGKFVMATQSGLFRFNPDGLLDGGFAMSGALATPGVEPFDVLVEADGGLVVSGLSLDMGLRKGVFAIGRYTSTGLADASFDGDGLTTTSLTQSNDFAFTILRQKDGKYVVHGLCTAASCLARYNHDGSLDDTFGSGGIVIRAGYSMVNWDSERAILDAEERIIIADTEGDQLILSRYLPNGDSDTGFGDAGELRARIPEAVDGVYITSLNQQSDGKFIVAGDFYTGTGTSSVYVARFLSDTSHNGDDDYDQLGTAVTTADIDGDGVDDFIHGAPRADAVIGDTIVKNAGSIKIISGKDNSVISLFYGKNTNQQLGSVMVAVPDQNSDNVPDLLVGEPRMNQVSLYSGATGNPLSVLLQPGTTNILKHRYGASLAYGDANNDGIADVIVGAPGGRMVYVYDGNAVFAGGNPAPLYTRAGTGIGFGAAVAVDQQHRLLVGSPSQTIRNTQTGADMLAAGMMEVFAGGDGSSAALLTLSGESAMERFGSAIAVAASDGSWLVGSPGYSEKTLVNGNNVTYRAKGRIQNFAAADGSLVKVVNGNASRDRFGSSVSALSDLDADGKSDVVVGAAKSDVSRPVDGVYTMMKASGRSHLLPGKNVLAP